MWWSVHGDDDSTRQPAASVSPPAFLHSGPSFPEERNKKNRRKWERFKDVMFVMTVEPVQRPLRLSSVCLDVIEETWSLNVSDLKGSAFSHFPSGKRLKIV